MNCVPAAHGGKYSHGGSTGVGSKEGEVPFRCNGQSFRTVNNRCPGGTVQKLVEFDAHGDGPGASPGEGKAPGERRALRLRGDAGHDGQKAEGRRAFVD